MRLGNYFSINSSFTRSINIADDLKTIDFCNNYIWTESNSLLLKRINYELSDQHKTVVCSLTGPFGSGKSAFMLQLLQLYGAAGKPIQKRSNVHLSEMANNGTHHLEGALRNNKKVFPLIITGDQISIKKSIVAAFLKAMKNHKIRVPRGLNKAYINDDLEKVSLVDVVKRFSSEIKGLKYNSLFLVVDEFGKLLEYAAMHPSKSDVYVLQQLAELRRADLSTNFAFFIMLHQSFEGYARHLSHDSQNEWTKIQGRFHNLNIAEKPMELVPLIGSAINRNTRKTSNGFFKDIDKKLKNQTAQYGEFPFAKEYDEHNILNITLSSYPLNLVSTFLLPFLSKIIGQNTRSTFTFLGSYENYSFLRFLEEDHDSHNPPQITLDRLFDYFSQSATQSYSNRFARRWHEVETALKRIEYENSIEKVLIKTIGILNIVQQPKLFPASEKMIQASLEGLGYSRQEINGAIKKLVEGKIIIFRKFAQEYRIWEGSDFDIDEAIEKRRENIFSAHDLVPYVEKLCPQQNIIARRHYEKTGTLRYFAVKFYGVDFLEKLKDRDLSLLKKESAEGIVCLIATLNSDEYDKATAIVEDLASPENILFIVAKPNFTLYDTLQDYVSLLDVLSSEVNLTNDVVAQKEVRDRINEAEEFILQLVNEIFFPFDPGFAIYEMSQSKKYKSRFCTSRKQFNRILSEIFDGIYSKAPIVKNELINRNIVSGTISYARRLVCRAIVNDLGKLDFGLEGYAAEATIARLLYKKTGMYRETKGGKWAFGEPTDKSWKCFWNDLRTYIKNNNNEEINVQVLLDYFAAPPYGIRNAVTAMTLIALLHSPNHGIALYDEGIYVPNIDEIVLELLCKRPYIFSVSQIGDEEKSKIVISELTQIFNLSDKQQEEGDELVVIIRELYRRIRRLPSYIHQTNKLPPKLKLFRDTILKAKRPEELVFKSLPEALGISSENFQEEQTIKLRNHAQKYAKCLMRSLKNLEKYMEKVKGECLAKLNQTFEINETDIKSSRGRLEKRATRIKDIVTDLQLTNMIMKSIDAEIKDEIWLEKLIGVISSKPIDSWSDIDRTSFLNNCKSLYRKFKNFELLGFDQEKRKKKSEEKVIQSELYKLSRLSITDTAGYDENVLFDDNTLSSPEVKTLYEKLKGELLGHDAEFLRAALFKFLKEDCLKDNK